MKYLIIILLTLGGFCSPSHLLAQYSGGDGTAGSPYQLSNAADLVALSQNTGDWQGKSFVLTQDVDMQGQTFTPIGSTLNVFQGTFDGKAHVISNLRVSPIVVDDVAQRGTGLFGAFSGTLSNLGIVNVSIDVSAYGNSSRVGALAGELVDGIVNKCYSEGGSVNAGAGGWTGGLIGALWESGNKTVEDCYSSATVKAGWRCAGVVGCTRGAHVINRVAFYGTINGKDAVVQVHDAKGGIAPTHAVYATTVGGTDVNATALDASALLLQASYPSFDFESVWTIDADKGYAVLRDTVIVPEIDFFDQLTTYRVASDSTIIWKNFGPGMSGYNEEFWCHPTDTNVMFMGPDMHVSYGTWDNGHSWQTIKDSDGEGTDMERVNDITFSTLNPDFGLAIERAGTVMKTEDRGKHWHLIYTIPHAATGRWTNAHSRIVIDPSDDNTWYVGSGGFWDVKANHRSAAEPHGKFLEIYAYGYILKTTDQGKTWTKIATSLSDSLDVGRIRVNPNNSDSIVIATGHGMFLSSDAGASWQASHTGLPNNLPKDLAEYYDPVTKEYVLYTMEQSVYSIKDNTIETSGGVFKSTDGGVSWTSITGDLGLDFTQISDYSYRENYAKAVGYWLGKTKAQVKALDYPSQTLQVYRRIVVNPNNKNEIYLHANQRHDINFGPGEIWKTEDGGITWKIVARHSSYWESGADGAYWRSKGMVTTPNVEFAHVRYANKEKHPTTIGVRHLAINKNGHVFIGVGQQTQRSVDGGASWQQIDDDETGEGTNTWVGRGASNLPGEAMLHNTGIPDRKLLCSGEHGLWQTDDLGHYPDKDAVAVRQIEGQVNDVNGNHALHTASTVAVHPNDPNTIFVIGFRQTHRGKLRKSTDGGKTWHNVADLFEADNAEYLSIAYPSSLQIDPVNPNNMYFTAVYKRLNSTAGGVDLTLGEYGVYRSVDGGYTWEMANAGLPEGASVQTIEMHPDHPEVLYAALNQGVNSDPSGLYRSTDKAEHWTEVSLPAAISSVTDVFIDPTTKYIYISLGSRSTSFSQGGAYRSKDDGQTWEQIFKAANVWHCETSPLNPNMVMVNVAGQPSTGIQNPGLYLSRDDCETWTKINTGLGNVNKMSDIELDPYTENILWASAYGSGWFKAIVPYEGVKAIANDAEAYENTALTLYGMGSLGAQLSYKWMLPEGIEADSDTDYKVTFTTPQVMSDSTLKVQLIVTNAEGSDTTEVLVQVKDGSPSSIEKTVPERFTIFPNPVSRGVLHLQGFDKNAFYTIVGLEGTVRQSAYVRHNQIDVSYLEDGLYIMHFDIDNVQFAQKIVVQKQ